MILRTRYLAEGESGSRGWDAFIKTQRAARPVGWITQPAHAALSGRIAASLEPGVFGALPDVVVEAIRLHDCGWAVSDLMSLECCIEAEPHSFLRESPAHAAAAWRRSIRNSECRSKLGCILTARHFCLLTPRDGNAEHEAFLNEETEWATAAASDNGFPQQDLERYTAALGFCDLLSLCLCSGMDGEICIPLMHPADPRSAEAEQVRVRICSSTVSFDRPILQAGTQIYVDGWTGRLPGPLTNHRYCWRLA